MNSIKKLTIPLSNDAPLPRRLPGRNKLENRIYIRLASHWFYKLILQLHIQSGLITGRWEERKYGTGSTWKSLRDLTFMN